LSLLAPRIAAAELPSARDLAQLSLEQLADLRVTSVSKKSERLSDAAASIFVITADDIRRSGAVGLPEALRLAPNLQVSQVSATGYDIRARGFNNTSANKLLVLIDGRSVYTPLFAGVFWDVQDVMLEDIDRIEVISGPGGTLWGVNAVNGVINIITRGARETQGALVSAGAGNREANGAVRYGAPLGSDGDGYFRVYAKYLDRSHTETASGARVDDGMYKSQVGFRADWDQPLGHLSAQGNAYRGTVGQPAPGSISISGFALALGPIPVSGENMTASWTRRLDGGSEMSLQAYYDRTERTVPPTFGEKLDIADVQFQHSVPLPAERSLVWGANYRYSIDDLANGDVFAFLPAHIHQHWSSVFAQGESGLGEGVRLTAGVRLERNDYTGTEILPNVRLAWKIAPERMLWTAASRTVRAPSRLDRDAFVPGHPPFLLAGGPDVRSEVAEVYEVGYRETFNAFSYSITAFHADYEHLHTQEIAPSRTFLTFDGLLHGRTDGVEMWGTWQAAPRWRLSAGYTAQRERLHLDPRSNDAGAIATAGRDPAYGWSLRSSHDLGARWELDVIGRGVAALSDPVVPAYATMDLRLGWKPARGVELWAAAQNLADGGHGEFTALDTRTELGRSFFLGVRWNYDTF
jgi:iron complex outermembrane recepter protein